MQSFVCAFFDSAAVAFGRPMFLPSVGVAMRSFSDEVNRVHDDNNMNKHPGDFMLYELGLYDDSDGSFTLLDKPKLLARAIDVVIKS